MLNIGRKKKDQREPFEKKTVHDLSRHWLAAAADGATDALSNALAVLPMRNDALSNALAVSPIEPPAKLYGNQHVSELLNL